MGKDMTYRILSTPSSGAIKGLQGEKDSFGPPSPQLNKKNSQTLASELVGMCVGIQLILTVLY